MKITLAVISIFLLALSSSLMIYNLAKLAEIEEKVGMLELREEALRRLKGWK